MLAEKPLYVNFRRTTPSSIAISAPLGVDVFHFDE